MKTSYIAFFVLAAFAIGAKTPEQFPEAQISNGIIKAKFYLPDTADGYYRGARFDWSGVMPELEYQGHSYFGQWFEKYSPTMHDAIMGPVEDFAPIGYNEAKVGENFLKIGIGMMTKPEEPKYFFVNPYQITNYGNWQVSKRNDQVQFVHKLQDSQYAYEYEKTVQLVKGKPRLVLSHSLKNTGKLTIETRVYDHNFFVMDKQPTGPDFTVNFPFKLASEGKGEEFGLTQENKILFTKELVKNQHLYYDSLKGFSSSAKDYDIKIENHKTGAAVRITSDQPLSRLVFWSAPATLCPEPYIHVKVNPGETFNWKIFYDFYICAKNN